MKTYLPFHCMLLFVTQATLDCCLPFYFSSTYCLKSNTSDWFSPFQSCSYITLLHNVRHSSKNHWSGWRKHSRKFGVADTIITKLQLTLIPFTICLCSVVWDLWRFLRSGEPLQIKMTWTDIPQTTWDHILCKLCIQSLWLLYCWLTRAVWKSATPGRKSSSEANLSSPEPLCWHLTSQANYMTL